MGLEQRNMYLSKYMRSLEKLQTDLFFTRSFHLRHIDSRRVAGLVEVLRTIPASSYEKVSPSFGNPLICFFLPEKEIKGIAKHITGDVNFVYLSPYLEERSGIEIQQVAAHELAHIVLNHSRGDCSAANKEREADALARSWGFELHGK